MYDQAGAQQQHPFMAAIVAHHAAQEFEVWPENMPAVNLFCRISTQWRSLGMGPSGLDYGVLFACLGRMHLSEQAHDWLFDDVRVIEAEALSIINKKD